MGQKHKRLTLIELPVVENKQGYEFHCYCPYYACETGILFNRNLINELIECPTCKREVHLYFTEIQQPGMEHIQRLKQAAIHMWKSRTNKGPETWQECIKIVLRRHRLWLSDRDTYSAYHSFDRYKVGG